MRKLLLLLFICFLAADTISVQGVLRNNNNQAIADADYTLTFDIYASESGGSPIWSSDIIANVVNGVYSVELTIESNTLKQFDEFWLHVNVEGESISTDRIRLNIENTGVLPIGSISMFPGSVPPDGWLLCDGSPLPDDAEYDNLNNLLAGMYGFSSGRSLTPDFQGIVPVGASSNFSLGDSGGQYSPTHSTHSHSATSSVSDPGHTHVTADVTHNHSIYDPSHTHSVNNPAHNHGVTDPGHLHSGDTYHHYSWGWGGYMGSGAGGGQGHTSVNSNTTGISVNNATTNISSNANTTGLANYNSATGVSASSVSTGISVSTSIDNSSSQGDQSYGNMMPYTTMNYIIKY